MNKTTYREAVKQSWNLTWNHKTLWIYGLLSLLLGQLGLGDFLGHLSQQANGQFWPAWIMSLKINNLSTAVGLVWVGGILLSLAIIFALASVIAQGGLISAAGNWYKKSKIEDTEKLWNTGLGRFWPLFFANLLRHILLFTLLVSMGFVWTGLLDRDGWWNGILIVAILTLEIFLAMIISSVFIYSAGYIVIDKNNLFRAIGRGYKLFSHHLLVSLELSLLLVILNVALILGLLALSTVFLLPSLIIWIVANFTGFNLINIGAITGFVIFVLVLALAGAIFNAFATSAWTYLFIKMHKEGIGSRLFHHLGRLFKR